MKIKVIMRSFFYAEFVWDTNSLSQTGTVCGMDLISSKNMVREWISKMKKGKVPVPSGLVSTSVDKAGIDVIIGLIKKITVEGVIPVEKET